MKTKMNKVLAVAMALIMVLALAACGGSGGNLPADRIGSYTLYEMTSDGETFDNEFLKSWDMEDMFTLELKEDGTADMTADGETQSFKWDEQKFKGGIIGDEVAYTYADGKLTMTLDGDVLVFQKK